MTILVLLLGACMTPAAVSDCAWPASNPTEAQAWKDSLFIVRAPELCDDPPPITVHYDVPELPSVCRGKGWRACAVHGLGTYEVHLLPGWDYHVLVHEFLHVQMWRLGWPGESHHERMQRLGFNP